MSRPTAHPIAPGSSLLDEHRRFGALELRAQVAAESRWLTRNRGARFGLLADNGCSWVITDLALREGSLLNVPLPGFFSAEQLQHVVDDAGIDALLTDSPKRAAMLGFVPGERSPQTGLHLARRTLDQPGPPVPDGTIKITYTSGSTGTPKGVCLSAAQLDAVVESLVMRLEPLGLTRHVCLLPLPTLLENVAGVYVALRTGATCHVPACDTIGIHHDGIDTQRLQALFARIAPESAITTPEILRTLVAACERGWPAPPNLRFIAVGGAVVARDLIEAARAAGLPAYEGYGLSECGSVVCLNTPGADRPGRVGRPLAHVRVRTNERGELVVAGPRVLGYLGGAGPRVAGIAAPADELPTGDLGSIDPEGFVQVDGRLKDVLITGHGRNVSPEWVESHLRLEPEIARALAIGDGRPFLAALIQPARRDFDAAAIEAAVTRANARLPDYARVRRWAAMNGAPAVADGTLTSNGRMKRDVLVTRHAALIEGLFSNA